MYYTTIERFFSLLLRPKQAISKSCVNIFMQLQIPHKSLFTVTLRDKFYYIPIFKGRLKMVIIININYFEFWRNYGYNIGIDSSMLVSCLSAMAIEQRYWRYRELFYLSACIINVYELVANWLNIGIQELLKKTVIYMYGNIVIAVVGSIGYGYVNTS